MFYCASFNIFEEHFLSSLTISFSITAMSCITMHESYINYTALFYSNMKLVANERICIYVQFFFE